MSAASYLEKIVYEKIYELFDDSLIESVEVNKYYDWLINPYTKKQLQLDFLIIFKEKIDFENNGVQTRKDGILAIEVQGKQHYTEQSEFHKKKNDLKHLQIRDRVKYQICRDSGIPLIRIKYNKISWKMDLQKIILSQLCKFKKEHEFGVKNYEFLVNHISNLSKFNYNTTKLPKDQLFIKNEWLGVLETGSI